MYSKSLTILVLMLSAGAHAQVSALGGGGILEYADGTQNGYRSLRFKRANGTVVMPFDEGLQFNSLGAASLSPDRQYSIVSFSIGGDLYGSSGVSGYREYLCAFVRMKDGCVVHVTQGEVCGGEWHSPHEWSINSEPIFDNPPNAVNTYAAYASKKKKGSQISKPPILAYLAEGTTFDNLLACDPPNAGNKDVYSKLLAQLKADGDTENAAKLTSIQVVPDAQGAWVLHTVISSRAYLYAEAEQSSVTKAFVIEGESVLVNESRFSRGFVLSKYRQKNGNNLERWVRCEDVNACPGAK